MNAARTLVVLPLLGMAAAGCAGEPADPAMVADADAAPDADPDVGFDVMVPELGYSGFDGEKPFRLPIGSTLTGDVAWVVEDPAVASIEAVEMAPSEFLSSWALVTTLAPGTTKIVATSNDGQVESVLIVTAYDP